MDDKEVKVEEKIEVKTKKVKLDPEWAASMQRAHEIKVAKFLAGGKRW